jgi:hypothetical protein
MNNANNTAETAPITVNPLVFNGITMKQASRDFLVRFYPDSSKRCDHRLMTINSLRNEIGDAFIVKFVEKFIQSGLQKQVFKLRRGIEIVLWAR